MQLLPFFHSNNGYTNVPHFYFTHTLPLLSNIKRRTGTLLFMRACSTKWPRIWPCYVLRNKFYCGSGVLKHGQGVFPVTTVKTGKWWCNRIARWFPVLCMSLSYVNVLNATEYMLYREVLAWGTFILRESLKSILSHSLAFCGLN